MVLAKRSTHSSLFLYGLSLKCFSTLVNGYFQVYFHLIKGNFVSGLNNSKHRDSPLSKGFFFGILSFDAFIEKQKLPNLFLL